MTTGRLLISLLVHIFHGLFFWDKDAVTLLGVAPSSFDAFVSSFPKS